MLERADLIRPTDEGAVTTEHIDETLIYAQARIDKMIKRLHTTTKQTTTATEPRAPDQG